MRRCFRDRRARQIQEYAAMFLGTSPEAAPALYSIMSHADLNLGVRPDQGPGATGALEDLLAMEKRAITEGCDFEEQPRP